MASSGGVGWTLPACLPACRIISLSFILSCMMPVGMDRPVWEIEDYHHLQKLHEGYASTVFSGVCSLSGKQVALKVYQPDRLHEISRHQLLREARLHVQLNHPNIIKMYAAFKQVSCWLNMHAVRHDPLSSDRADYTFCIHT